MKKAIFVLILVFAAFTVCFELWPTPMTTVHVTRTIPAGGTIWTAVESAMAETGDPRPVDEVVYETMLINPSIKAGYVQPGTRIIVPCQVDK